MPDPSIAEQITTLLSSAEAGDRRAADSLLPLVYEQLKEVARGKMAKEPAGHTLQPTALVHEAYLRIAGSRDPGWDNARHFFAAAAEAMRRILVERARAKKRDKRGGGMGRVELEDVEPEIESPTTDVLDLHAAIERLEAQDPRKGKIAVLRCFAGLSPKDTAATLDVSLSTVEREWRFARAWLCQEMEGGLPD